MSDQADDKPADGGAAAPRKRGKGLLVTVLLLTMAGGGGGAWYWFGTAASADGVAEVAAAAPIFVEIDSNLIVNFQGGGRMRYLQLGLEVMTRDQRVVDALERNLPVLRDRLILLFSDQSYEAIATREGKEQLREQALAETRSVLPESLADPGVEELYFTNFVMQ
jgi:flagellar protein FliL